MIPQTPRHDFLRSLHELLQPATYLEIGVQTGRSLAQAIPPTRCIGIDPDPQISVPIAAPYEIVTARSSTYFELGDMDLPGIPVIDLAFIDGSHLIEDVLSDFIGVEANSRTDGRTVAVFDDVLPYSAAIAGREPLPGDWAGDCWKIHDILAEYRPDLTLVVVDVAPTGALVVLGLDPASTVLPEAYEQITLNYAREFTIHVGDFLGEWTRVTPAVALGTIRDHLNITEA